MRGKHQIGGNRYKDVGNNYIQKWRKSYKKYFKPKWLWFCEQMFKDGWSVKVKMAVNTNSKYVKVSKNTITKKIRFSEHPPGRVKDSDFYVGGQTKSSLSTGDVINYLKFLATEIIPPKSEVYICQYI